ncbi:MULTISPECIES: hypothetical protein [Lonsdalea]|uniref:Uncharacterized protein n=2 Tax=Lonsdalea TaxID=1082702 RepID=A0ACD1JDP0_9GAMM|nr:MULTISPECIES: hypothetical protein [Lonsdalea]OSM96157.1 hypothetical protein AU508_09950 [Lonsdalea populi]RAT14303.1 hypothetical protein AU485_06495 [Lonsdalea quercina]RAT16314.1 hypothetical protein AU486_08045 [Lonsdalea quercina]RAT20842.1 hypothetical protein AU487_07060 [Lonsdalea populi]RAT25780.1 hypothetical protein AU489_06300 [Lonsdalea populi]
MITADLYLLKEVTALRTVIGFMISIMNDEQRDSLRELAETRVVKSDHKHLSKLDDGDAAAVAEDINDLIVATTKLGTVNKASQD